MSVYVGVPPDLDAVRQNWSDAAARDAAPRVCAATSQDVRLGTDLFREQSTLFRALELYSLYASSFGVAREKDAATFVACAVIAAKVEADQSVYKSIASFIARLGPGATAQDVCACEEEVLSGLDFRVAAPSSHQLMLASARSLTSRDRLRCETRLLDMLKRPGLLSAVGRSAIADAAVGMTLGAHASSLTPADAWHPVARACGADPSVYPAGTDLAPFDVPCEPRSRLSHAQRLTQIEPLRPMDASLNGSFATMFFSDTRPGIIVKKFNNVPGLTPLSWSAVLEVSMLRLLPASDRIVQLIDAFCTGGSMYAVLERADGDLFTAVNTWGAKEVKRRAIPITTDILAGLAFLHAHGIVHRDIKPENILIFANGDVAKIADLGLVAYTPVFDGRKCATDQVGTFQYMAPEMLIHKASDDAVDVWAAGVIFLLLLTTALPLDEDGSNLPHSVRTQNQLGRIAQLCNAAPERWEGTGGVVSDGLAAFRIDPFELAVLRKMLAVKATDRISAEAALALLQTTREKRTVDRSVSDMLRNVRSRMERWAASA